jgi:hypothetical protein
MRSMAPGEVVLTLSGRAWCAAHRDAAVTAQRPVSRGRSAARIRFSGGLCIAPYDGRPARAFEIFEVPLEGFRISGGRGSR